ncbi:hypothetical protein ABIE88_000792 [Bradyrhizobium diazoefficiens]
MTSKYSALGRLRLAIHEQRQRFRRGVAQPFVDGEAVALRLRDLLALLVEEELVVEAFGRRGAERPGDRAGELQGIDQVLAGHLVVDTERNPAHRPVGLPLALDVAAGDGRLDFLVGIRIDIGHRAGRDIAADHRHLEHDSGGLADGQERRIGRAAVRPQRRQDDRHDLVVGGEHLQQRRVETAGRIIVGRARELVVEAEMIEEGAQAGVVVVPERRIFVGERIRHARQRLAEMRSQHLLVGDVVRHFPKPVHVVGEGEQARLDLVLGQHAKGMAHHRGARDLAERADMRQARGAVAGLEQHLVLRAFLQPRDNGLRLLERPGVGLFGERTQVARIRGKIDNGHQGPPGRGK